jgi:hypothetical protein
MIPPGKFDEIILCRLKEAGFHRNSGAKRHIASHLQFWSFPAWRSNLKICYTFLMQSPREDWNRWVETLRRYQADGFVSWFLDAGRPLAILSAQMLYLGRPFLGETAGAIGQMLESDEDSREFAALLNGGTP